MEALALASAVALGGLLAGIFTNGILARKVLRLRAHLAIWPGLGALAAAIIICIALLALGGRGIVWKFALIFIGCHLLFQFLALRSHRPVGSSFAIAVAFGAVPWLLVTVVILTVGLVNANHAA